MSKKRAKPHPEISDIQVSPSMKMEKNQPGSLLTSQDPTHSSYIDSYRQRVINALERPGTFVEQTLTPREPLQGALVPFTRVVDLSDDLRLVPLEELQERDLILHRYDKYHSSENDADFLTLEVSLLDNPEERFLTNCGGQTAMRKIEAAFQALADGKATPPLVASFRKILTTSNRSFWVVE